MCDKGFALVFKVTEIFDTFVGFFFLAFFSSQTAGFALTILLTACEVPGA